MSLLSTRQHSLTRLTLVVGTMAMTTHSSPTLTPTSASLNSLWVTQPTASSVITLGEELSIGCIHCPFPTADGSCCPDWGVIRFAVAGTAADDCDVVDVSLYQLVRREKEFQ